MAQRFRILPFLSVLFPFVLQSALYFLLSLTTAFDQQTTHWQLTSENVDVENDQQGTSL